MATSFAGYPRRRPGRRCTLVVRPIALRAQANSPLAAMATLVRSPISPPTRWRATRSLGSLRRYRLSSCREAAVPTPRLRSVDSGSQSDPPTRYGSRRQPPFLPGRWQVAKTLHGQSRFGPNRGVAVRSRSDDGRRPRRAGGHGLFCGSPQIACHGDRAPRPASLKSETGACTASRARRWPGTAKPYRSRSARRSSSTRRPPERARRRSADAAVADRRTAPRAPA